MAKGVGRMDKQVLDATCGGRSIWSEANKDRDDTLYVDCRDEKPDLGEHGEHNRRDYDISPDEVQDFRNLPYGDGEFNLIVFDPPHIMRDGGMEQLSGIMTKKYGSLEAETWQSDLSQGFEELWRVLSGGGTLVFKFADNAVDFESVLSLAPVEPMFGTTTKKGTNETRWFVFYKPEASD